MILGTMDLTGATVLKGGNYLLPGEYTLKVLSAETTTTQTGKKQLKVIFKAKKGEEITEFYMLDGQHEYSKKLMLTLLTCLGNDMTKFTGRITTDMLIAKKMNVIVKRKYNDYKNAFYSRIHVMKQYEGVDLYNKNETEIKAMEHEAQRTGQTGQAPQNANSGFAPSEEQAFNIDFNIDIDDLPF